MYSLYSHLLLLIEYHPIRIFIYKVVLIVKNKFRVVFYL